MFDPKLFHEKLVECGVNFYTGVPDSLLKPFCFYVNDNVPEDLLIDLSEEQLEIEIEKMQRSLENIGPINMAVQDEFEEQESRLEILIEQRVDLISSEDNLRETIQKIDKVARAKFQKTFDKIKINFAKLFEIFFEGGIASLTLVGDPDPLESDIAIHAQPPGKKNQSLRMLSAGEKSLTACLLYTSPSPRD